MIYNNNITIKYAFFSSGPPTGGVSEEEAPNVNKRTKLIDPEVRVENDGKIDVATCFILEYYNYSVLQVPHALCTMEFTPKMKSPPAASTAGPGFAPAALPYESRLWRKEVLKIQIRNRHLLDRSTDQVHGVCQQVV